MTGLYSCASRFHADADLTYLNLSSQGTNRTMPHALPAVPVPGR